jgi:hypothetical protein
MKTIIIAIFAVFAISIYVQNAPELSACAVKIFIFIEALIITFKSIYLEFICRSNIERLKLSNREFKMHLLETDVPKIIIILRRSRLLPR